MIFSPVNDVRGPAVTSFAPFLSIISFVVEVSVLADVRDLEIEKPAVEPPMSQGTDPIWKYGSSLETRSSNVRKPPIVVESSVLELSANLSSLATCNMTRRRFVRSAGIQE